MFTHYNKYRDINLKFPYFAPQHNSSKLDFVLGLASVVILSSSEPLGRRPKGLKSRISLCI